MSARLPSVAEMAETHAAAFLADRPWSAAEFEALIASKGVAVIGAAQCFALIRVVAEEAELLTIATHPAAQRQGRAAQVLQQVIAEVQRQEVRLLFLEVAADNIPAVTLYQKAGFAQVGQRRGYYVRPNQSPVDALVMQAKLAE